MNQSLLSLIRPNVHGSLLCTNVFNHICRAVFPKLTQSMKMCIVAICYPIVFVHWSGYIFFSVCDANSVHVHWVLTTTWMNTHIRIIDNNAVQIWHMAAIGLSEFWKIAPQFVPKNRNRAFANSISSMVKQFRTLCILIRQWSRLFVLLIQIRRVIQFRRTWSTDFIIGHPNS